MKDEIWAIVPVKKLLYSKQRLAHLLPAHERADLIAKLLQQTLTVCRQTAGISRTVVISADERVRRIAAQAAQTMFVAEAFSRGLNTAVSEAMQVATIAGAAATLILPADLPYLKTADLTSLIRNFQMAMPLSNGQLSQAVIIAPDEKKEGTNALLLSLPTTFHFQYGPGSFQKHLTAANERGIMPQIVQKTGLAFDLDLEEDWKKYQNCAHLQASASL